MVSNPSYEAVVVGGGPAGMTTALYATRLGHRTAVVDRGSGRYASVASVHNFLGVSEDVSGREVADAAIGQLDEYGADYYEDDVRAVERAEGDDGERFRIAADRADLGAERVVFATGFADEPPRVENLRRFTGRGLHYCLHCDAYTLGDEPVFVLGHDDSAAHAALVMLNFTDEVDLLLDDEEPTWSDEVADRVESHPVDVVPDPVERAFAEGEAAGDGDHGGEREPRQTEPAGDARASSDSSDGDDWLGGLEFADGRTETYGGGFAMYGLEYNSGLAEALGCELNDDGSIEVDENRETSVAGAYAVGDVTHGQNQTPIALGDGAYAGIALHKDLRTFPRPADETDGETEVPAMADDLRARMRRMRERDEHAGMRPPE